VAEKRTARNGCATRRTRSGPPRKSIPGAKCTPRKAGPTRAGGATLPSSGQALRVAATGCLPKTLSGLPCGLEDVIARRNEDRIRNSRIGRNAGQCDGAHHGGDNRPRPFCSLAERNRLQVAGNQPGQLEKSFHGCVTSFLVRPREFAP